MTTTARVPASARMRALEQDDCDVRRFPMSTMVTPEVPAHVVVRSSALGPHAGRGVFALRRMRVGETLGRYAGEWLTPEELDRRYGGAEALAPYALTLTCLSALDCGMHSDGWARGRRARQRHTPHQVIVDAADARQSNWTRYVNDGPRSGLRANVAFTCDGHLLVVQPIDAGEELYVDYGPEYWGT